MKKSKNIDFLPPGEFLTIPSIFEEKDLTGPAIKLLSWIHQMWLNCEWVKASNKYLAERLHKSQRSIADAKKELVDLGLVKITTSSSGRGWVSEYELQVEAIKRYFNITQADEKQEELPAEKPKPEKRANIRSGKLSKKMMEKMNNKKIIVYED